MPNTNFAAHLSEDRRLVILRVLLESAAFTANEYVLQSMVERFGHVTSGDRIRTDLAWLQEQGLVRVEEVATVQIAMLLQRGEDVALGRIITPGVKRPSAARGA
jgi:hypothetical protein